MPARAAAFTWNPAALIDGAGQAYFPGTAAFSADALSVYETTHVKALAGGGWTEHGFARVTGIINADSASVPAGMGSAYTLYVEYYDTGSANNLTSLSMSLYGVAGSATFGYDGNQDAYANLPGTPLELATSNTPVRGSTGIGQDGSVFGDVFSLFQPTAVGTPMFEPGVALPILRSYFYHAPGSADLAFTADGFTLTGGQNTLSFVPEPASAWLLAAGLPLLVRRLSRRRGG